MKKILLTLLILSLSVLAACGANRDEQPMENQTENGSQMQDSGTRAAERTIPCRTDRMTSPHRTRS